MDNLYNITVPCIQIDPHKYVESLPSYCQPYRFYMFGVNAPAKYKKAVYTLAKYFRREFGYDFVQYGYEGRETDTSHHAFIVAANNHLAASPIVGAGCFRYRTYTDHKPMQALQWVWFHPYVRRRGILAGLWVTFLDHFGNFHVEPPLSKAMNGFIRKHGTQEQQSNVGQ